MSRVDRETRERRSGLALFTAAALALAWANSPWLPIYTLVWHSPIIPLPGVSAAGAAVDVINEGLMAFFFLSLGLGIRREGALASRRAAIPIAAALGGVIFPALIYLGFNAGGPGSAGWGVPMATDPAFALGALALLANRIPVALRSLLAAIAVVDDIVAILVIAAVYHSNVDWQFLIWAFAVMALLVGTRVTVFRQVATVYALLAVLLWLSLARGGISPTLAGAMVALALPAPLALRIEEPLSRWVNYAVVPLFAVANTGVVLQGDAWAALGPVTLGVAAGLVIGKQVGITLGAWLAVQSRLAQLPSDVRWMQVYGIGWLGGLGFTTSLFIAELAFGGTSAFEEAKVGILLGALVAGVGGYGLLAFAGRDRRKLDGF